jgi:DNA polymerase
MTQPVHLDWETRCVLDLSDVGLDVYLRHPSFEIIMANYSFGDGKVRTWEPHLVSKIPSDLEDALLDPFQTIHAWGANFERQVTKRAFGIDKPTTEWVCVMAVSRYAGLPGALDEAGAILNLGNQAKLKTGKQLIKLFCEPVEEGGEETLFGISEPLFNTPQSHPTEWAQFVAYGKQDVVAERAAEKRLRGFWPSEEEWETWRLDSKINETGWPVDLLLVDNAKEIALKTRAPLLKRLKNLTETENPESRNQILEWVQGQGYLFSSLGKDFIARALAGECELTPEGREALELRLQTAKSSVSKYTALADMTAPDARLRYQYTYYGAHTGRWAAHGVNVGNLLKPTKEVEKKLNLAIELVQKMDYARIEKEFKSPLDVAAGVQRSAFRAPEGYKFVVADLNAIENRVLGFLARCDEILKVFREGLDPYLAFAVQMYKKPYAELLDEFNAGDKSRRTVCKAPVLGGGYALGPGEERVDKVTGLRYFTGLMGYARNMGIELTQEEATKSISVLRQSWKEVTWLWKDMERAAAFAIRHPGHLTGVGVPELKWEFDMFENKGRKIQDPLIHFKCISDKVLEMILPSGRPLYYWNPRVETQHKTWTGMKDGREVTREYDQDVIFYHSKDPKTKQWIETDTFGGHLVENGDQGEARDILVHGMKLADQRGFEIVGTTYDELITLVPLDSNLGIKELCECMSDPPARYNGQLPLSANGFEDVVYRKDS